jgi:hypothetical protein
MLDEASFWVRAPAGVIAAIGTFQDITIKVHGLLGIWIR